MFLAYAAFILPSHGVAREIFILPSRLIPPAPGSLIVDLFQAPLNLCLSFWKHA